MLGPSLDQNGGIATAEKLILMHAPPEIKIQHITTHDEGTITHRVIVFAQAVWSLLWILLRKEADVLHLHLSERGSAFRKIIITLIAATFHKPVLVHANGAEFHLFFSGLPKLLQQTLSWIFRRFTSFLVVSRNWKEFYVNSLGLKPEQVFVLPNPVELPPQVPHRINVTKVKLVFFGRVGQRKGAFDLIRAFANLPAFVKDRSELILAGDGEVEKGRNLAQQLNLTNHVTFLGWVDSEQRDKILAQADVFILPSYNEGLPLAILEAMAWGLPIITTPVGGIPELVTSNKNGLLVNPGDVQQLSEAMQSLIVNEVLRLALGNTAKLTVAAFDVKHFCGYLADIYLSLLQVNWVPGDGNVRTQFNGNSSPYSAP